MSSPPINRIPIEEDVDLEIGLFNFIKVELDDGTILRGAPIPVKILRTGILDSQGFPQYIVEMKNNVSAIVPKELRGQKDASQTPWTPTDNMDPIDFNPLREPLNRFDLADGTTLNIRTTVTRVLKSEKRNDLGEPVYQIFTGRNIDPRYPEHLRRK